MPRLICSVPASGSWIGTPDFALLEDTLAPALGPWPLPKLGVLVLVGFAVRRWGLARLGSNDHAPCGGVFAARGLLDASGVIPSALMVVGVVALSFVKPMAFSRYFVVLLPALITYLAVQGGPCASESQGPGHRPDDYGLVGGVVVAAGFSGNRAPAGRRPRVG